MTDKRRYCTQRFDTHTCELRFGHADFHRSEYGEPVPSSEPDGWGKYPLVAQVVSWL
jgi:hypothetical protein